MSITRSLEEQRLEFSRRRLVPVPCAPFRRYPCRHVCIYAVTTEVLERRWRGVVMLNA